MHTLNQIYAVCSKRNRFLHLILVFMLLCCENCHIQEHCRNTKKICKKTNKLEVAILLEFLNLYKAFFTQRSFDVGCILLLYFRV